MRRNNIVARFPLIFSITNVVLAAPALVPQRRLVTDRADDEPTDESEQALGSLAEPVHQDGVVSATPPSGWLPAGSEESPSDSQVQQVLHWLDEVLGKPLSPISPLHPDYMLEPPFGSSHQNLAPVSGAPDSPESHDDLPIVHGGPRLQPAPFPWWLHTTERPPSQFEVGEPSSSVDTEAPERFPPASGAQQLHDDTTPWWHDLDPVTDIEHHFHRSFKWSPERDHGHRFS
jgi:hypothetical protein